ncbi:ribonuclease HI [Helicobacter mustelae]|uniref:Ribonuclease HI n=1 Tax=Helicobacter mustelae (strain ATCC 43772 / CCUG 25715 / CIP 103759 / LMG 18044 / NCTC 12198 / R85-136P) TaxID=679897 RepID=D3UJ51_HELM1|nr:ribonuclease HI [Helicobacter mustelae]CBG40526.1 ribonuclease HI [Helicobacter mustelae 12198]SQH72024.1 ribonuclease HI [Helicobacter mustelae]
MKKVEIYCDGSSLGNPGFGGYCAILRYKKQEKILCGAVSHTTNNRMELLAVIEAIKALKEPCQITIYSDSRYVCDGVEKWIFHWIKKDFKNVKNPDLWREFLRVSLHHKIQTHWIKGHSNHAENEKCDTIAREQAKKLKEQYAKS